MKPNRLFVTLLLLQFTFVFSAKAEIVTGSCGDNSTFSLDKETGELVISGSGSIGNNSEWSSYRSAIRTIIIEEGITSIDDWVFAGIDDMMGFNNFESVAFPSSLVNIGGYAFHRCRSLYTFASTLAPTIGEKNFSEGSVFLVPKESIDNYQTADNLSKFSMRIIPNDPSFNTRTITVTAKEDGYGIHEVIPEAEERYVINLKVSGSINGYDLLVLSKKMNCLRNLDLSEARIVANPFKYYEDYESENDVLGPYAFSEKVTLYSISIPAYISEIGRYAFDKCSSLQFVTFPSTVKLIGENAFRLCENMEGIVIPNSVIEIGNSAFEMCWKLKDITLSNNLKTLGSSVFSQCPSITEIHFPASLKKVGEWLFMYSDGLRKVYSSVLDPFELSEGSFTAEAYNNATLYIPQIKDTHDLYYASKGWSRFVQLEDYDPSLENCYIENDYTLQDMDGDRIHGDGSSDPNMEMNEGSGLIVEGSENQPFDGLDVYHDGTDGASLITDGNVTADHLRFHISVTGGRWYFFCFPFDIKFTNITAPGRSVWRHYNGNDRAVNGQGGWKNVETVDLKAGKGYIFQCDQSGTLDLTIDPEAYGNFAKQNANITLETHAAANPQNASWNFVGNPYLSYYNIDDMGTNSNIANVFSTPITVWDGTQYVAYRPGDDDYHLKPFEAFFVQKTESDNSLTFDGDDKMTQTQSVANATQARARRAASRVNPDRLLVDITLVGADENVEPDRTRVVFNAKASEAYEVGTDASKFMTTGVPQLWTSDGVQTLYAINERPAPEAGVEMGFYAPQTGAYTLKGKRMDTEVTLVDNYTGEAVVLTADGYTFLSEKGTFADRFVILLGNTTNVRNALMTEDAGAEYYNVAGQRIDGADTKGIVIKQADGKAAKNLGR